MKCLLLVALLPLAAQALVCPPNFCDSVKCPERLLCDSKDGYVKEKGSFCGCCDTCITYLNFGGRCATNFGMPQTHECRPGLACVGGMCQFILPRGEVASKATQCQLMLQQAQSSGLLGAFTPSCDQDGSFSARQCHGSMCWCVGRDGKQLEKYSGSIGQAANMKCGCARKEQIIAAFTRPMLSCDNMGNYKPFQCTGSVCYCADNLTGAQIGDGVAIGQLGALHC